MFGRIAELVTRRPRLVLAVWIVLVGALAVRGLDLDQEMTIHPIYIDGTSNKRAHEIVQNRFGTEDAMIVMLRGPRDEVEEDGPELAAQLDAMPGSLIASPWTRNVAVDGLRPSPGVAAILLRIERGRGQSLEDTLPPVQQQIDDTVTPPVRASVAGLPAVIESYRHATGRAAVVGELIAVPVLLIVLLLVLRSVLAAVIPVVIGGAVVAATRGGLSLLLGIVQIDAFALGAIGMMGLALGVDYSLLVVSRFREERAVGDLATAVKKTVKATARSIVPAGSALVLAVGAASQLIPGSLGTSVAVAVAVATAISMLSALIVVPALLMVAGDSLDRWSLPQTKRRGAALLWSQRLWKRPAIVVSIMFALLLSASWAFTLRSEVSAVELLPAEEPGRLQQEEIQDALGPGWVAPIEVVINGRGSPITTPERLDALAAFQRRIEADPGVETMSGLSPIERQANQLDGIEDGIEEQEHGLVRLDNGLARVRNGAELNTTGLVGAAEGARRLGAGVGATHTGAGMLADGLRATSTGSDRLSDGLGSVSEGSGRLASGTSKASAGAGRLAEGLEKAKEQTGEASAGARLIKNAMRSGNDRLDELRKPIQGTEQRLEAALKALRQMSAGRSDPEYAAALQATEEASQRLSGTDPRSGEPAGEDPEGVEAGVDRAAGQFDLGLYLAAQLDENSRKARKGVAKLAKASARLDDGLGRLAAGSRNMTDGIAELADGGGELSPALRRLSEGAERLVAGLGQLQAGTSELAGGLGGGAQKSTLLTGALQRIGTGLDRQRNASGSFQLDQLRERSPGLFESGYFVLAGLDGSPPERRHQVNFLLNIDRGGLDARMTVILRADPWTSQARETTDRILVGAESLARQTGTEVAVGGLTPSQIDLNAAFRDNAPMIRIVLSLVSLLILIPVMRSLTMPFLAALLNLLTVSASFGLLALLFGSSLLGGPGYIDGTVIPSAIMVMFGLAIDYEVFIFARMREEYVRTGSPSEALTNGLRQTAPVITGAALIMVAVFLAFSVSSFITVRNFGVAQAIGVLIDAFLIRLIVIPALMNALGKWSWWMPAWLDRLLPGGGTPPAKTEAAEAS